MDIITSDNARFIDVGSSDIWFSLNYTIEILLKNYSKSIRLVKKFLSNGQCISKNAKETSEQMQVVRKMLELYSVDDVVYDKANLTRKAPWLNNRSANLTTCNKAFVTADEKKKIFTQEDIMKALDYCYQQSLNGINRVSPPIDQFAEDYLKKESDERKAAKAMIKNQIRKCTTSGFITGFGGVITLPITIPANIGSVLYVQIRMIACIAYMAGYNLNSDQVQTLVYACLAGVSVNEFVKQAGIKVGEKVVEKAIEKIPGKTLTKINQKVGFRLVTKFGEKGIVNLGKMIPVVGATINGSLDYVETKVIAGRSYNMFFEGDFSAGEDESLETDDIIDSDITLVEKDK